MTAAGTTRRLTATGWSFLVLGLLLTTTRWWPGAWIPVPATALLGTLLLATLLMAWWWSAARLAPASAAWRLPPTVPAREEVPVAALISSRTALPPVTVLAWDLRARRLVPVTRLAGLDAAGVRPGWTMRFPRRGLVTLPPLRLACRLPFGLVAVERPAGEAAEVVVLPPKGHLRRAARERLAAFTAAGTTARLPDGDDLAHLRPYRPGDRPQAIHWRATARLGNLLVAERQAAVGRQAPVVLDVRPGAGLERRITLAATVLDHLAATGITGILHLPGQIVPGPLTAQWEALALVAADPQPLAGYLPPGAVVISDDAPPGDGFLILGQAALVEGAA